MGKEGGEGGWEVLKRCRTEGDVCARSTAMVVWDNWLGWEVEDGITDLAS